MYNDEEDPTGPAPQLSPPLYFTTRLDDLDLELEDELELELDDQLEGSLLLLDGGWKP